MLVGSWAAVGRVVVIGILGYLALVLLLRISGKRTLSKFNAFDLVVTVAIGSSFATVLLSKQVAQRHSPGYERCAAASPGRAGDGGE